MDADFKKKSLGDVNEQLINKWIKITNTYSSGMLNKCLEVFSNNTSLVFWLKEATNGMCLHIELHILQLTYITECMCYSYNQTSNITTAK